MCLLDSKTNTAHTAHCSPSRKTCSCRTWGSFGTWCVFSSLLFFVVSFFEVLHLPLCSHRVSMTSFHDARKARLAHEASCSFSARTQGKQEGSPRAGLSSRENREPWKLDCPHVGAGLFLSGMMDAHTHIHTHTLTLTLAPTHRGNDWFVRTHCST